MSALWIVGLVVLAVAVGYVAGFLDILGIGPH